MPPSADQLGLKVGDVVIPKIEPKPNMESSFGPYKVWKKTEQEVWIEDSHGNHVASFNLTDDVFLPREESQ